MRFSCECCNYQTNHRGSYDKHLLTYKHHKNKKKNLLEDSKNPSEDSKNPPGDSNLICKFCLKNFTTNSNLHRHFRICNKKIIVEYKIIKLSI